MNVAELAEASAGANGFDAGDLSFGATVGAIGVGFLFALAIAAYLFYRLFPLFFGTPILAVLKS